MIKQLLLTVALAWPVLAVPILSNLPGDDANASFLGGAAVKGFAFTMGPQAYELDSVLVRLQNANTAGVATFTMDFHLNGPGNTPGAFQANLGSWAVDPGGPDTYGFYPLSTRILAANTTYWLLVTADVSNAKILGSIPNETPVGVGATYLGSVFSLDNGATFPVSSQIPSFEVNATTGRVLVPEPASACLLAAGLVGLAWRRRIGKGH
jgi:hypothetical protein